MGIGEPIEVIDTPGFLDSSGADDQVMYEIFDCLSNYTGRGFNICLMPLSALDPRLDG
jgi:hypothetical protein